MICAVSWESCGDLGGRRDDAREISHGATTENKDVQKMRAFVWVAINLASSVALADVTDEKCEIVPLNRNREEVITFFAENVYGVRPAFKDFKPVAEVVKTEELAELNAGKDNALSFDQHWVLGAVAPRLLAVGSADEDWWACPSGEMVGWEYSRQAWKDRANSIYHVRHGKHGIMDEDWREYLDFAKEKGWME